MDLAIRNVADLVAGTTRQKKIEMAPPLSSHIDDSMRKLRTQESHGNLGVRATIFGREERSVSI